MVSRFLNPTNDVAFKKVFAAPEHRPLLISLLNALLQRKGDERIKEVEILPSELIPHTDGGKTSILDVRCIDERNFQYIVEIQKNYMSAFLRRIQFYAAKTYTHQLEKGQDYLTLKPVILLAILNHTLFPETVPCVSYHDNVERTTKDSYLKDLSYVMVELPKFQRKPGKIRDTLEGWLAYLKDAPTQREIPEGAPEEIQEAYQIVERMAWTFGEIEAYDRAIMREMDEKDLLRTAHDKGMEKGLQKGLKEGIEKEKLAIAKAMLKKGMPFGVIQEITGLSQEILQGINE